MVSIKEYLYNELPIPTFRTVIGSAIEDVILTEDKKNIVVIINDKTPKQKINLILTLLTTNKIVKNAIQQEFNIKDYNVDIVVVENENLHYNVSLRDVNRFNNVAKEVSRITNSIDTYNNMFLSNRNKLYELYNDIKQIKSKRQMKMFIELGTMDDSAELLKLLTEKTLDELFKEERSFQIDVDQIPEELVSDIIVKLKENLLIAVDSEELKDPYKVLKSAISRDIVIRKFVIRYLQSVGYKPTPRRGRKKKRGGEQ